MLLLLCSLRPAGHLINLPVPKVLAIKPKSYARIEASAKIVYYNATQANPVQILFSIELIPPFLLALSLALKQNVPRLYSEVEPQDIYAGYSNGSKKFNKNRRKPRKTPIWADTHGEKWYFLFLMPAAFPIEFLNLIFLYSRIQLEGCLRTGVHIGAGSRRWQFST